MYTVHGGAIQCGVECDKLHGVRCWLDHEHWAEQRSVGVHSMRGGAIQCRVEYHKLHGVRCRLNHEHRPE